jgi:hypothetical protein
VAEALLEGEAAALTRKAIELALLALLLRSYCYGCWCAS